MKRIFSKLIITSALAVLSGCAAYGRVAPLEKTFLQDVDIEKKMDNMPFMHSWVWDENVERAQIKALFIPPITTSTLSADAGLASLSVLIPNDEAYRAKAREIADYFRQQLIENIKNYKNNRYEIADAKGPSTAVVEIALTELELLHPVARAATVVSPMPGTGAAMSTITQPHAAFALRISDGESGKLWATAADRRFPPTRLIDLNEFTVSSSAREICGFWAEELAAALQEGSFGKVEKVGVFRFLPW